MSLDPRARVPQSLSTTVSSARLPLDLNMSK
jgi:hypothetical protein